MLHAVNHGKATPADVTEKGKRTPLEDLITSAVFGPLIYSGDASRIFFNRMMDKAGFKHDVGFFRGDEDIRVIFWPKLPRTGVERRYVEPDVIVVGNVEACPKVLIIEIKWNAHLGPNQLNDQWEACHQCGASLGLEDVKNTDFKHLLLVRNRHHDDLRQLDAHPDKGNARLLTWHDISELVAKGTGMADLWAGDVKDFLQRLGVRTQGGWAAVALEGVDYIPARFTALPCPAQLGWSDRSLAQVSSISTFYAGEGNE